MRAFANYHPLSLASYFVFVLLVAMFVWNPVLQLATLCGGICFCIMMQGKRAVIELIRFYLPLFLLIAITNPLFSHNGDTVLFFLNGHPITFESLAYGSAMAIMIVGVMLWCKCYSLIMTSDKFSYITGKASPKISLVLSMSLRFIPMFKKQLHKVSRAQRAMGLFSSNGYANKVKSAMRLLSALITWSLENSVESASSMKARGYGIKGRSNFSVFHFTSRDTVMVIMCILFMTVILIGVSLGKAKFLFYPHISQIDSSPFAYIMYIAYGILVFLPFIIEVKESIKWKYYISKI